MISMNQRDRLWVQREWIAWGFYVRDGCTFPNALGYKSTTVEYALMQGETGGDGVSHDKVPTRYNLDSNVEKLQKTYAKLPQDQQEAIAGVYVYRMPARRIGLIVGVTRHKIQLRLWEAYRTTLDNLTNEIHSY